MIDVLILTDIAAIIGMLVPRKTFVGIGGFWGLKNEIVAPALRAGGDLCDDGGHRSSMSRLEFFSQFPSVFATNR